MQQKFVELLNILEGDMLWERTKVGLGMVRAQGQAIRKPQDYWTKIIYKGE